MPSTTSDKLTLSPESLLALADDQKTTSLTSWARFMHDTKVDRASYAIRMAHFQEHRTRLEIGIKLAVTVTLGVGLIFAAPATLLFGAAGTLYLSYLIYSCIKLPKHQVPQPQELVNKENFDATQWQAYRADWATNARNAGLSIEQKALQTNMTRVGMLLVAGFAAFAMISSSLGIALVISMIIFAAALFNPRIEEAALYFKLDKESKENNETLPPLASLLANHSAVAAKPAEVPPAAEAKPAAPAPSV